MRTVLLTSVFLGAVLVTPSKATCFVNAIIPAPTLFTTTTDGVNDQSLYGVPTTYSGLDMIYEVTIPAGLTVEIKLTSTADPANVDIDMLLMSSGNCTSNPLVWASSIGNSETIYYMGDGGSLWIVIDEFWDNVANYTFTLSIQFLTVPTEQKTWGGIKALYDE